MYKTRLCCWQADITGINLQIFKHVLGQQVIAFNEVLKFNILPEHKFLNVSVWGKGDKNTLLGHVSLPLTPLCVFTVGHHVNTFSLLPPLPHLINKSVQVFLCKAEAYWVMTKPSHVPKLPVCDIINLYNKCRHIYFMQVFFNMNSTTNNIVPKAQKPLQSTPD